MKKILSLLVMAIVFTSVYSPMPMLGDKAPRFTAQTTNGELVFPTDYFGKWKIILSHPSAFTPVCTTELLELSYLQDDFKKLNTELVVLSTDGLNSHIEWVESMGSIQYKDKEKANIKYPIIADVGLEISRKYGMNNTN